jgi:hypothetical protein
MATKLLKILYMVFVSLSLLLCLIFNWVNVKEIVLTASGDDTHFNQMFAISDTNILLYSTAYLIPYLTLMILGTYYFYKGKKKGAIIISALIWGLTATELYTDTLLLISV